MQTENYEDMRRDEVKKAILKAIYPEKPTPSKGSYRVWTEEDLILEEIDIGKKKKALIKKLEESKF